MAGASDPKKGITQYSALDYKIKATEDKMSSIVENYKGYYDEEGQFDVWGEAQGKSAFKDYLRKETR